MIPPTAGRSRWWRRAAQVVVTVGLLGFLGWSISRRWSEVPGVLDELSLPGLALAGLAAGLGGIFGFLAWRAILTDFGAALPLVAATRIFYVGQLTKYLPGKVWPILVQARLGRAYQVPGRASAAAALLTMLISLGTGLLLTAAALPLLGERAFAGLRWTLPVLPVVLVLLWPPLLNRMLGRLLRLARREPMPRALSPRGVAGAVGWSLAAWLAYGMHLWLLLVDIGAGGPELLVPAVGAFAGSWSIGFLLAVAPAGVGPREVALPLLLGATVVPSAALVVAVVSRLLLTAVDLVLPAMAVSAEWARRRSGRRPGTGATPKPPPTPRPAEPPTVPGPALASAGGGPAPAVAGMGPPSDPAGMGPASDPAGVGPACGPVASTVDRAENSESATRQQ
ncbi:lysylphosphatidylglycerol synthase domain-containing protein [Plantactinospora soyae]|uniref:Uncharacterized membrane protein YbhN (UPF0104 family) n=1 Tax=Plantactinospora soyae TaxID=1544732 RepID=A0A927LZ92_9ACTN|nr:lysylphosphatidylglycerol synthase domain-containing protein [Plantactinospora soyae]MBE1485124.1 uncharacterized membrane protein YbhN (UPF0104 family) [Plantactinospora soyae]